MQLFGRRDQASGTWTRVAAAADVAPGTIHATSVGDTDLVVWRTADGTAVTSNARCPHAFAHLAAVSEIDGDDLVCTVHCWRFDATGASWVGGRWYREPRPALGAYPTRERDGWVEALLP